MGNQKYIEQIIDNKLLEMHTAYIAKVLAVYNDNTAKIQPLGKIQSTDGEVITQSVLTSVPILESALYKWDIAQKSITYMTGATASASVNGSPSLNLGKTTKSIVDGNQTTQTFTYVSSGSVSHNVTVGVTITKQTQKTTIDYPVRTKMKAGDLVLVVCCERDITEALKGNDAIPLSGHHTQTASVIVGIIA